MECDKIKIKNYFGFRKKLTGRDLALGYHTLRSLKHL